MRKSAYFKHRGLYASPRWLRLRRQIFSRDRYRCRECGKAGFLECDHITPITEGGDFWDPENLQTLCRGCHIRKTAGEHRRRPRKDPRREAWRNFRDELIP